jgi:mRNA interferase MazF
VQRGELFHLVVPRSRRGLEQRGQRYGVVVQADELVALSTVIVAPTSTSALPASFRPEVTIRGRRTKVLVEQLGAVDPSRLGRSAGMLGSVQMRAVDDALSLVLGLA